MALISIACAAMLRLGSCDAAPDVQPLESSPFVQSAVPDAELDTVRGTGLPVAGIDQREAAEAAMAIPVGQVSVLPSELVREMTDNWNIQVAAVLIADATNRSR